MNQTRAIAAAVLAAAAVLMPIATTSATAETAGSNASPGIEQRVRVFHISYYSEPEKINMVGYRVYWQCIDYFPEDGWWGIETEWSTVNVGYGECPPTNP